ncbi:copper transport protein CCH [Cajanus cajan]|uniref:copper transport protein CCH n=1 Tax=Cajanus cajan TaxID=3821 RepID=UPI00098DA105|nr:copper transport protein CCH [Cajanus cajan]
MSSQTVVLKVGMSCQGCAGAVNRVLGKMEGVESFDIDLKEQKVTVKGNVQPDEVLQAVSKTGKKTAFWVDEAPPENKPSETAPVASTENDNKSSESAPVASTENDKKPSESAPVASDNKLSESAPVASDNKLSESATVASAEPENKPAETAIETVA